VGELDNNIPNVTILTMFETRGLEQPQQDLNDNYKTEINCIFFLELGILLLWTWNILGNAWKNIKRERWSDLDIPIAKHTWKT